MESEVPLADQDATAITTESPDDNISLDDFKAKIAGTPAAAVAEPELAPSQPAPRGRHRAKSQRAGPEDTPRIAELTRRLRETEAERDALKTGVRSTAAAVSSPTEPPPSAAVAPARPAPAASVPASPVKSAADDPEPDSTKYDDLTQWIRDHNRWSSREERRLERAEEARTTEAEQQRVETARLTEQWTKGVTESKARHQDFEQVAYGEAFWPKDSLPDAWVKTHRNGAELLYYLKGHRSEVDAMLALPLIDQVEALTLLLQRLPGSRTAAVVTGAAPAPLAQPVSRPPTPVRTGPMRTGDEPPDPEAVDLSEHRRFYGTPKSRRLPR